MASADEVKAEVRAEAEDPDFLQRLAERIGASAHAAAVFGEPVDREGVTVIPVAKATWGFGGGSGGEAENQGSGGGGGSFVSPLGYIEVRAGRAEFKPLRDPRVAAVVAGAAREEQPPRRPSR
jgi:uncharacterized spore protein YtfJ